MQITEDVLDLSKNREFNIWEYHVSHGSLLLRSPKRENFDTNVDIIFAGVEYISGPTILGFLEFSKPTEAERSLVGKAINTRMNGCTLWAWNTEWNTKSARLLIAGGWFKICENAYPIVSSPFEFIRRVPNEDEG